MRRTITVDELSKRGRSKDEPDVQKAYRVYNSNQELTKKLVIADNVWDVYSAVNFDDAQRKQLEFYLCGWLQYYDQISRSYGSDHEIHFEWSDHDVVVYIYPAPGRTPFSPLTGPPSATSDPKSPGAPPPPYP